MLLFPFLLIAVVGLVLSVVSHAAALLGQPQPLGKAAWALHAVIFVVWVPAIILANRLCAENKRKDFWEVVLRGCPRWVRGVTAGFFAYAVVNFLLGVVAAPPPMGGADAPPGVFRMFSGHWMALYSAAAAVLYSVIVVGRRGPGWRCPVGHPVSPSDAYCEACGQPGERAGAPERGGP